MRREFPKVFEKEDKEREMRRRRYQEDGVEWKEFEDGYPEIKPFSGDFLRFDAQYYVDIMDAANKDIRKQELKQKYFDQEVVKDKVSEEKFESEFGYKK
mmetsp:Transcript_16550/g.19145  ORF Transcript_16550/g.19145 Transcript_16550/m.19145 type:complete len:99 (+) Transcript_16550:834-1130(+)